MQYFTLFVAALACLSSSVSAQDDTNPFRPDPSAPGVKYSVLKPHNVPRSLTGLLRRQSCRAGFAECTNVDGFCCPVGSSCCTGVGA